LDANSESIRHHLNDDTGDQAVFSCHSDRRIAGGAG
jgi:hypothetical protein